MFFAALSNLKLIDCTSFQYSFPCKQQVFLFSLLLLEAKVNSVYMYLVYVSQGSSRTVMWFCAWQQCCPGEQGLQAASVVREMGGSEEESL